MLRHMRRDTEPAHLRDEACRVIGLVRPEGDAAGGRQLAIISIAASRSVATSVNAVISKRGDVGATEQQMHHADALATALGFDMNDWWQPTAENFFGKISKPDILAAIDEPKGSHATDAEKMKKAELAAYAERQITGTGWLPAILRTQQEQPEPLAEAAE